MRNALFILGFIVLFSGTAFAGGYHGPHKSIIKNTYVTNIDESSKNEFGAKLDAPNLVRINDDWTIGTEGGKDLWRTDVNEGWFVYGKITYSGTLINLKKE